MQVDHAGLATDDLDGLAETYTALFGVDVAHRETFDGMDVAFLDFGNAYFELLEPIDGEGAIASYLAERGPGIHHLAIATENIDDALDRAREMDLRLIDEDPRTGAWGHEVAFMHPKSTGGILLEFVEH